MHRLSCDPVGGNDVDAMLTVENILLVDHARQHVLKRPGIDERSDIDQVEEPLPYRTIRGQEICGSPEKVPADSETIVHELTGNTLRRADAIVVEIIEGIAHKTKNTVAALSRLFDHALHPDVFKKHGIGEQAASVASGNNCSIEGPHGGSGKDVGQQRLVAGGRTASGKQHFHGPHSKRAISAAAGKNQRRLFRGRAHEPAPEITQGGRDFSSSQSESRERFHSAGGNAAPGNSFRVARARCKGCARRNLHSRH